MVLLDVATEHGIVLVLEGPGNVGVAPLQRDTRGTPPRPAAAAAKD